MHSIFSDQSIFTLEFNNRNISIKCPHTCQLKNMLLNSHKWHKEKKYQWNNFLNVLN